MLEPKEGRSSRAVFSGLGLERKTHEVQEQTNHLALQTREYHEGAYRRPHHALRATVASPVTAIAYIRVSSKAQGFASQKAAIAKAAAARGDGIAHWYSEKKSAKTVKRPELERLRAYARAGKLCGQRLYIFRLDRLTRSGIRDTLEVLEELRGGGCEVVAVSDGFPLTGPYAEVVIAVMSWASAMELRAKNERISAARERLEAEGKPWGRPKRMSDDVIAKAVAMRETGKTIREIAAALKTPRATVGRALVSQKVARKGAV